MTVIERWTIWHTPGTTPGTHKSYVEGPAAGDWAGQGVEVVPSTTYQGAVEALVWIAQGHHGADCQQRASKALEALGVEPPTTGGQLQGAVESLREFHEALQQERHGTVSAEWAAYAVDTILRRLRGQS